MILSMREHATAFDRTEAFETTCHTVRLSIEGDKDSVTLRNKSVGLQKGNTEKITALLYRFKKDIL